MRRGIGLLWIVGSFAVVTAVCAQTPTPPANTAFDGTYQFVSITRVNETYTTFSNRSGQCPVPDPTKRRQPVTVVNGAAQWTDLRGRQFEGTVLPTGQLTMDSTEPSRRNRHLGQERTVLGMIDGNGTVHARLMSRGCSYDWVLQKETK
jgi:hypothetical protein